MMLFSLNMRAKQMINEVYCCYNKYLEALEIRKSEPCAVATTEEYNYGVQLQFDINMNLVGIIIPEPEVLFGVDLKYLREFTCHNT